MKKWLLCALSLVSLNINAEEVWYDSCCPDTSGPYVSASYLYWYSKLEQLPLVIQGDLTNGSDDSLQEMNYDWKSGFKVGAGYKLPCDSLDVFLNWTHIRPTAHGSFNVATGPNQVMGAILADGLLQGNQIVIIVSESAKAHWHLNYNTLDFELGKDFFLCGNFYVRPFAGIKWGSLNQKFHVEYHNNFEFDVVTPTTAVPFALTTQDFKIHDNAVGPRIGLETRWNIFGSDVAFLANGAISLLWHQTKLDSLGTVQDPDPSKIRNDIFRTKIKYMEPVFELFLGFDWHYCFCEGYAVDLAAGYEMQLWLDQTQTAFGEEQGISNHRNLSLQGLTASATFEF